MSESQLTIAVIGGTSTFQNVAAAHLKDERHQADCDVLVCGNDPEARKIIIALAEAIGFRALEAGIA
jgi:predicted dinucleotide-binding enzyme